MEVSLSGAVVDKIMEVRGQYVIIDSDVAELYGVETKRVNEAVKNNPDKFPEGYLFHLTREEWTLLKSKFSTSMKGGKVKLPTAFTERGLYMLATILKGAAATQTTLAIVDTFVKVREIGHTIQQMPNISPESAKYKALTKKTGDLISDLIMPEALETADTEASIELNLAVVKFKYSVKKKAK